MKNAFLTDQSSYPHLLQQGIRTFDRSQRHRDEVFAAPGTSISADSQASGYHTPPASISSTPSLEEFRSLLQPWLEEFKSDLKCWIADVIAENVRNGIKELLRGGSHADEFAPCF